MTVLLSRCCRIELTMKRKATRAELAAEGYKPSSRRSFDTELGHTISRHAAEIRPRLDQLGYDDAHQRASVRKQFGYAHGREGLTEAEEKLWNEARTEGFTKATRKAPGKNVGPQSKIAQFLVSIGIRDAAAEYDVGETPK